MRTYDLYFATPFRVWCLDHTQVPDLPQDLPVDMTKVLEVLASNEAVVDLKGALISQKALPTGSLPKGCPETEHELFQMIIDGGVNVLKDFCVVRVIPLHQEEDEIRQRNVDHGASTMRDDNGMLRLHRDVIKAVATKLVTLRTEVVEALDALSMATSVEMDPETFPDYLAFTDESVIDAVLLLGHLDRGSRDFHVHDILSPSIREALQTITHEIMQANDGLGHTALDSTAANLIREYEGAEAGDEHERMMAEALGNSSEHPELAPASTEAPQTTPEGE